MSDIFYTTGTITVVNGSKAVSGIGVVWQDIKEGDTLNCAGATGFIDTITGVNLDQGTLKTNWEGTSQAGHGYAILKTSPLRFDKSLILSKLDELLLKLAGAGVIYYVTGS